MTLRARDLPEVRSRLLRYLGQEAVEEWTPQTPGGGPEARASVAATSRALRDAELFYVAAEMADVAEVARESIPEVRLLHEDVPAPCGLLAWERPAAAADQPVAITWGPDHSRDLEPVPGVTVRIWLDGAKVADAHEREGASSWEGVTTEQMRQRRLLHSGGVHLAWSDTPATWDSGWLAEPTYFDTARMTVATWLLMGQTIVAQRWERLRPAERRRLARRGDPLGDVRYVALRRTVAPREDDEPAEQAARARHHRWWTRGHWRNQWYPSEDRHWPIWIAPHLRGPEGAPLLNREVVHTLRR